MAWQNLKKKVVQSQPLQSDETIKSLLQVHHIHVDILASMRVDACREYRLSKVENVLVRLTAGETKCSKLLQHSEAQKSHSEQTLEKEL